MGVVTEARTRLELGRSEPGFVAGLEATLDEKEIAEDNRPDGGGLRGVDGAPNRDADPLEKAADEVRLPETGFGGEGRLLRADRLPLGGEDCNMEDPPENPDKTPETESIRPCVDAKFSSPELMITTPDGDTPALGIAGELN